MLLPDTEAPAEVDGPTEPVEDALLAERAEEALEEPAEPEPKDPVPAPPRLLECMPDASALAPEPIWPLDGAADAPAELLAATDEAEEAVEAMLDTLEPPEPLLRDEVGPAAEDATVDAADPLESLLRDEVGPVADDAMLPPLPPGDEVAPEGLEVPEVPTEVLAPPDVLPTRLDAADAPFVAPDDTAALDATPVDDEATDVGVDTPLEGKAKDDAVSCDEAALAWDDDEISGVLTAGTVLETTTPPELPPTVPLAEEHAP